MHSFNSIVLQKLDDKGKKIEALEEARLANVPVDTKEEINNLNLKIVSTLQMRNFSLIIVMYFVFVNSMHIFSLIRLLSPKRRMCCLKTKLH